MSTNLLTAEGVAFRRKINLRLHPHDLAAIDAARGTSLERADWLRWALRDALKRAGVPPYGEEHEVEVECPVCREPAALFVCVAWEGGTPELGIAPGWRGQPAWGLEGHAGSQCDCLLSESDILSACERAVEQFERSLHGEALENPGAKP